MIIKIVGLGLNPLSITIKYHTINMEKSYETIKLANREYGPEATKVTNLERNLKLKNVILSYWNIGNKKDFFPAPQPVSLERSYMHKLLGDYLVCVKSDGMRFLLMYYENVCYMVDRAFKFYVVRLNIKLNDSQTPTPTPYPTAVTPNPNPALQILLDGELILNNNNKWQYIVHDCIVMSGIVVSDSIFPVRLAEISNFVKNIYSEEDSVFGITEKTFLPFRSLHLLHHIVENVEHNTDGIIFTPKNKKVGIHTQYDLFKWKPKNLHTFDFKIAIETIGNVDNITAYVSDKGENIPYAQCVEDSDEGRIFIEGLSKNCPEFSNGSIVECEFRDNLFYPIKVRSDKVHPNSLKTIRGTLVNITEDITLEELCELGNS